MKEPSGTPGSTGSPARSANRMRLSRDGAEPGAVATDLGRRFGHGRVRNARVTKGRVGDCRVGN